MNINDKEFPLIKLLFIVIIVERAKKKEEIEVPVLDDIVSLSSIDFEKISHLISM